MQLSVTPISPRTNLKTEWPVSDLAAAEAPKTPEIIKTLRMCGGTPFTEELIEQGALEVSDFGTNRRATRLWQTAHVLQHNYEKALESSVGVFRDFSRRFLMQAQALTWTRVIALSPKEVEDRFRPLHIELLDPMKTGSEDAEFRTTDFTIRIPVPLVGGDFSYADFVHEALHGIAGRHAVSVEVKHRGKVCSKTDEVMRTGLQFDVPNLEGESTHFEWLNEGLVEYLVDHFVPEEKKTDVAYVDEVNIIRALVAPDGHYKIPLEKITAAYFADYDPSAEIGLRYPEWHDLVQVFPTRQILKISQLIEQNGAEATVDLMTSRNIFTLSERDLGL